MKQILVILFSTIILSICSHQKLEWIPFNFVGDSIEGRYFDKLAITIPVTIDDLPHNFMMQLDLGAIRTTFYGNTIDSYCEEYNSLRTQLDSTYNFKNINLQLGTVKFNNIDVEYMKDFGEEISKDSLCSKTPKLVGTIAPDIFQNKILILDYKSSRLAVTDTLPDEYKDLPFERFEIDKGRIKIPFQINGKRELLMFDTGSSIFTLSTNKENAFQISNPNIIDSLTVHSWGESITCYGLETIKPIMFGKKEMKKSIVYYEESRDFDYFYKSENIWGLTGNAYFFDNIVIIDYKNHLFRIK
jgi:hypothetical protein